MRYIKKQVSGFCPEAEGIQSIEIVFAEIHMLGQSVPGYKAQQYSCPYYDEYGCASNGVDGTKCPLFEKGAVQMI